MKRILLMSVVIVGIVSMAATQGFAFSLYNNYTGPLNIHFEAWNDGTTYTAELDGSGAWTGYWIPDDGGAKVLDSTYGVADGDVDSYGVGTVTSITKVPTGPIWTPPFDGSETLDTHLYGLDDNMVQGVFDLSGNLTGFRVETVGSTATGGAYLDLYLGPGAAAFDPLNKPAAIGTVTDGTPFLRLRFVPVGANGTVYTTVFDTSLTGHGYGYLEVVTGWGDPQWESIFDSNYYDSISPGADFYLYNDYGTDNAPPWLVKAQDPVTGYAIPEPASMAIFGLGLLGLGAIRRKRG